MTVKGFLAASCLASRSSCCPQSEIGDEYKKRWAAENLTRVDGKKRQQDPPDQPAWRGKMVA